MQMGERIPPNKIGLLSNAWDRFSSGRKPNAPGTPEPPAAHLSQILAELKEHDMQPVAPPAPDIEQLVAEQRKAAEALLFEACMLEKRVQHDAAAAEIAAQHAAAGEKLDRARAVEREAQSIADSATRQVVSATAALEEAQRQLHDAQSMLEGYQSRAQECAAERAAAETEAAEAAAAVKACDERRKGAVNDARALAARIAEQAAAVSANGSASAAA
jgi:chromosome segregation ATPase